MTYVIWHKPTCSTSRFVLAALREAGADVVVRDYVKDPPDAPELRRVLRLLGTGPRGLLRRKGTSHDELGLGDPDLSDEQLIMAMAAHPLLIERPVVLGPGRGMLCRPKERIFEIVPR